MPAVSPLTTPVEEPMVATDMLLLLQLPPVVASDNVVVLPTHTAAVPVMPAGSGFTVATAVV